MASFVETVNWIQFDDKPLDKCETPECNNPKKSKLSHYCKECGRKLMQKGQARSRLVLILKLRGTNGKSKRT